MDLIINLSKVKAYWHPIVLNRLIRFIRFIKYPWKVMEESKIEIQQSLKLRLQNLQSDLKG
jgi:hypothetical protein